MLNTSQACQDGGKKCDENGIPIHLFACANDVAAVESPVALLGQIQILPLITGRIMPSDVCSGWPPRHWLTLVLLVWGLTRGANKAQDGNVLQGRADLLLVA